MNASSLIRAGEPPASTPSTPPRVLVAGDWHGNARWATGLIRLARKLDIDIVLQLGDFGIWQRRTTPPYLNALEWQAKASDVVVYALGGNHDNAEEWMAFQEHADADGFVLLRPHVRWVPRGQRWQWNGVEFGALGGAFSVDWRSRFPGRNWWPGQEELGEDDIARLGDAPLDVLVTHDVPLGMEPRLQFIEEIPPKTEEAARRTRSLVLRALRVTQAKLVLHGHWHRRNRLTARDADGQTFRVEGLASDVEASTDSWGVLHLPSLEFQGGDEVAQLRAD